MRSTRVVPPPKILSFSRPRALSLAACALALVAPLTLAREAGAIKWRECPGPPAAVYPSTLGAVGSPFAHPGHALRITVNAAQVASGGGFSVEQDGNEVDIVFASLFGAPVPLASRRAAATSPDLLELTFPDTEAEVGRVLSGPVEIRVRRGDRLVASIAAQDLVALPPATDVTGLILGEGKRAVIPGALGATGDVWVPVKFKGDPMAMPGCPGNYIQPVPVAIGGALLADQLGGRRDPLRQRRRISLFLGDVVINDTSYYGVEYLKRIPTMHVAGTLGVSICKMNDTMDLVLRVKGSRSWARSRRSPFGPAVQDASPVRLELRAGQPAPGKIAWLESRGDTFGNACSATPPHAVNDEHGKQARP